MIDSIDARLRMSRVFRHFAQGVLAAFVVIGGPIFAGGVAAAAPSALPIIVYHQIRNTGRGLLVTINFYSPPAYTDDGEPK